jgi:hypothetical protein
MEASIASGYGGRRRRRICPPQLPEPPPADARRQPLGMEVREERARAQRARRRTARVQQRQPSPRGGAQGLRACLPHGGPCAALRVARPPGSGAIRLASAFSGYHLYYPSRRQPSPAFSLLVEALRHRDRWPVAQRGARLLRLAIGCGQVSF